MSKNKKQHYLPAFYLYNFTNKDQRDACSDKRKTCIHHYDFKKRCFKERPIEKVATESYILSYENADGSYNHSLDQEVQKIENRAAKAVDELTSILKNLLKKKPKAVEINNSVIDEIIELLFWQIKRHPGMVEELKNKSEQYCMENSKPTKNAKQMALKAIETMGKTGRYDIQEELHKKNKIILFTSTNNAHFITTDKPFVRFNKNGKNGIAVQGTEMYFPITSNMLIWMYGNGNRKEFRLEKSRKFLRDINTNIAKSASRYLFGPSKDYLKRIKKNIG